MDDFTQFIAQCQGLKKMPRGVVSVDAYMDSVRVQLTIDEFRRRFWGKPGVYRDTNRTDTGKAYHYGYSAGNGLKFTAVAMGNVIEAHKERVA